jgi:hypothetical protein
MVISMTGTLAPAPDRRFSIPDRPGHMSPHTTRHPGPVWRRRAYDSCVAKGIVRPELADRADAVDLERQSAMERATRSGESERDDYVGLATLPLFPPFVAVRLAA